MNEFVQQGAFATLARIIHESSLVGQTHAQVDYILESIARENSVDTVSVYRKTANRKLELVVSTGRLKHDCAILPLDSGLVALVAKSKNTLNIIAPHLHPDYIDFSNSHEQSYQSFFAVPLFDRCEVIGVLVLQSTQSCEIPEEMQALLTTLAVHLGLLVAQYDSIVNSKSQNNVVYAGVAGAPGIAVAPVKVNLAPKLNDVKETVSTDAEYEIEDWSQAKNKTLASLTIEKEQISTELTESIASIIDAYIMMLVDPKLDKLIRTEIHKGVCFPWALKVVIGELADSFRAITEPYLQAKFEDVENLGDLIYQSWSGDNALVSGDNTSPVILAGENISVSTLAKLPRDQLAGLICFNGSALSHIAVLANALGIPAIMGTGSIPLLNGDEVILDADAGEVIYCPTKSVITEYQDTICDRSHLHDIFTSSCCYPAVTLDGTAVEVMANTGLLADVDPCLKYGAEGIGLYRTEIPFLIKSVLPSESEQVEIYQQVFQKFENKPIYVRTLDLGSDKTLDYLPPLIEDNPALGLRGVRFTLSQLSLLNTQIRAILIAAQDNDNVHITFPMVGSTEQLNEVIAITHAGVRELNAEGISVAIPKIGVMVEVPSSISLLPFWVNKIDYISIGTNDLNQYLLAIDRNNPLVNKWYDNLHPAIVVELQRIAKILQNSRVSTTVCGEMASDPIAMAFLLGLGFRKFSMSAARIPIIKSMIRNLYMTDLNNLVNDALKKDTGKAIRDLGRDYLKRRWSDFSRLD